MTLRDVLQAWIDSGRELTADVVRAVDDAWAMQKLDASVAEIPDPYKCQSCGNHCSLIVGGRCPMCFGRPRVTSTPPYLPPIETTGPELTRLPDEQTCEVK